MEKEEELEIGLLQQAEREMGKPRRTEPVERPAPEPEDEGPEDDGPEEESQESSPRRRADDDDRPPLGQRIKSYLVAILVFAVIVAGVTGAVFFSGLRDLRDDTRYIVVVQQDDVPKAGTLYRPKERKSEPFNIGSFPSTRDMERFLEHAKRNDARVFDKVVVLNVDAMATLSRDDVAYGERQVPVSGLADYLLDAAAIPAELKGDDAADWETKSKLLGAWVEQYHGRVWKGEDDYNRLLGQYRESDVFPYPSNGALFLLKILPLERLFA
jgi:hypothetical protein